MNILILGGTRFVGRALVDAALAAGNRVTLFNRGRTNPELYPDVEKIRGDRSGDLSEISAREWDAVFDVAAYDPDLVERSTAALAAAGRYVFVSTVSVYADQSRPHGEEWPLLELREDTPEPERYGARKARAESVVAGRFPGRGLIVRAGMIVGPHDPTDRLTYWPRRIARGGTVLAPGSPADPLQFIDVRDLAQWMVRATEMSLAGAYNVTGSPIPFRDLIDACASVTGSHPEIVWITGERLLRAGVDPWMGVPLWIGAEGWQAANLVDVSRAVASGLTFRPLPDIVRDAWNDDRRRRTEGHVPEMFTAEAEADLFLRLGPDDSSRRPARTPIG